MLDWPHAEAHCRNEGGDLVAMSSLEEYNWVVQEEYMLGYNQFWMGLASVEEYSWAQYRHINRTQLQHIPFDPMSTPSHCVYSQREYDDGAGGTINAWIKSDCSKNLTYVCERPYIIEYTTEAHTTTTPRPTTANHTLPPLDVGGSTYPITTEWTFPTYTFPPGYTGSIPASIGTITDAFGSTIPVYPWSTPPQLPPGQTYGPDVWVPPYTLGTDPDGNIYYPTPAIPTTPWNFPTFIVGTDYTGATAGTNPDGSPVINWTPPSSIGTDENGLPIVTDGFGGSEVYTDWLPPSSIAPGEYPTPPVSTRFPFEPTTPYASTLYPGQSTIGPHGHPEESNCGNLEDLLPGEVEASYLFGYDAETRVVCLVYPQKDIRLVTWYDANDWCANKVNGSLVSLEIEFKYNYAKEKAVKHLGNLVGENLGSTLFYWIGLQRKLGFTWNDKDQTELLPELVSLFSAPTSESDLQTEESCYFTRNEVNGQLSWNPRNCNQTGTAPINFVCETQAGICPHGYRPRVYVKVDGYKDIGCYPINECIEIDGICGSSVAGFCSNEDPTQGGLGHSCNCRDGFRNEVIGDVETPCVDIDECVEFPDVCGVHPDGYNCHNENGDVYCTCNTGYKLVENGTCVDVDECVEYPNYCGPSSEGCENTIGGVTCTCSAGYRMVNGTCFEIDECYEDAQICGTHQVCVNHIGQTVWPNGYECICNEGFVFNDVTCVDIDECSNDPNICLDVIATCHNEIGRYTCSCPFWDVDGAHLVYELVNQQCGPEDARANYVMYNGESKVPTATTPAMEEEFAEDKEVKFSWLDQFLAEKRK